MKKIIGFVMLALAASGCLAVKESDGAGGGGGSGGEGGGAAACKADADCDDGHYCTLDACDAEHGVCVTSQKNCDDGDASTTDWCDETKYGLCQHTVGECTGDAQCNDGIACTSDVCGADAKCKHFTDDSVCSGGKTCDVDLGCVACASDADCNDGVACTTDACTSGHVCTHAASNAACDDGNANTTDSCDSVAGCLHVSAGVESCNGIDDDNDGQIDDGNPGGGIACPTGLAGVCAAGTTKCQGGAIICVQNVAASAEAGHCLDGIDNDCDGKTDGADQIDCPANNVEVCDGVDNDNDGFVDENNPGGGVSCSTGLLGICSPGTTKCQGGQIVCVQNVQPGVETVAAGTCGNLIDDDCDGLIDVGGDPSCQQCQNGQQLTCAYGGPANTLNVGLCKAGVQTCSNGVYGACVGQVTPVAEVCNNGLDDDCNGVVDNGCGVNCVNGQTQACYTGPNGTSGVGVCHGGTQTCVNSQWGACVGEVTPVTEICADSIDNNCNGTKDEPGCQGGGGPVCSTTVNGSYTPPNGAGSITWNFYQVCSSSPGNGASSSSSPVNLSFVGTPGTAVEFNGQITGFGWLCSEPQQGNPVVSFGVPSIPGYSYSGKLISGSSMGPGTYGYAHDVNAPSNWGCNWFVCPSTPPGQQPVNCLVQ